MQRLLMGEVGSGKTVVALYAMLRVAEDGMQAALMAPTETLAEQHFATIQSLIGEGLFAAEESTKLGPPVGLLTGSTPARERAEVLERLRTGELRLLVGTHALIQDAVEFDRLALAVVDEQHRFGVRQRTALDRKARGELSPHLLHLTATPIPRTLSLTLYGDLDTTALRELPRAGARSRRGSSRRKSATARTSSSASACARGGSASSSARWSRSRRRCRHAPPPPRPSAWPPASSRPSKST